MSTISIERPSRPLAEVPDGELVREHIDGRDEAFAVLYRRYNDRLVGWFVRRTGDRVLAEDLAQDTMVRVLKYADSFDQDRPMWPWLKTTAFRVMVDHLDATPDDDKSFEDQYEDEGEPDPRLASIEERPGLERILGQLSERHQTALSLRYVRGWSPDDVADFFGMTSNACYQLLYRARNAARREYDRVCGEARAIVAPIFGGAFAKMRTLGGRVRQTMEAIGLGSAAAAAEALAHLAIGLALATVGASGALASTSSPDKSAPVDVPAMELTAFEAEEHAALDTGRPDVEPAPVPESRMERTADPTSSRDRVGVEASSGDLSTELPASMHAHAGGDSDDQVSVTTRIFAYVPGRQEDYPVLEAAAGVRCNAGSTIADTACAGLDAVEEVVPPPDG